MKWLWFAPVLLSLQESLEDRRDRLGARLEEIRGLQPKEPLRIRDGSRKEYAQVALDGARKIYGENLDVAEAFLKALGLIPGAMKLSIAVSANAAIGVGAFTTGGEVVVIDRSTPDDLLLNRMATGLLDQHHPEADLRRKAGPGFDAQMAITALRAGDADLCKVLLWFSRKRDEKLPEEWCAQQIRDAEKWEKEDSKFKSSVFPRLFVRSSDFGYRRGGIFVRALHEKGGMAMIEKAYEKPPTSTEQILHPEKYLEGETPVELDVSPIEEYLRTLGYGCSYRTTLGEFGAAVLLETHLKNFDSAAYVSGWGGDTILLFEGQGLWFMVWATEWDTEKDAEEFQSAIQRVSQSLLPKERARTNVVVRRKTATAWLFNYPTAIQDGLLDALWKCRKNRKAVYGE